MTSHFCQWWILNRQWLARQSNRVVAWPHLHSNIPHLSQVSQTGSSLEAPFYNNDETRDYEIR
jgi:hypothetical protein